MNKNLKIALNLAIFGLVIGFIWYMATSVNKEERLYADTGQQKSEPFVSPYKDLTVYDIPAEVNRFELYNDRLYVSAGQSVYVYTTEGERINDFTVKPDVRDITVAGDRIYILYPTFIEVYSPQGEMVHEWEACSELSDYCSLAIAGDYVFVTDAENKNICKYTQEGNFVKFIKSPRDFIIPSYSFDIESRNDTIYCVNSGRHLVETYDLNGDFIAAFGGPGGEAGFFAGCCNPAFITFNSQGEIITSEKGNPRVSYYERNGDFKDVLLTNRLLGGGYKAYQVKAQQDTLFVAGKNKITVYRHEGDMTNS